MKNQKEAIAELKKMKNRLILRYVMIALGFAAQLGGFWILWRHDWTLAFGVALIIIGHGWVNRAGER